MSRRLILFDVDGTLIERGDPAHVAAIDHGVATVFPAAAGVSALDVEIDGRLDRQIARAMLAHAGVALDESADALAAVFLAGGESYRLAWEGRTGDDDLLPGVRALLDRLANDKRFVLGVLTGGSRLIVEYKLRRLDLTHYFPIGAFGDEVDTRSELVPLAVARAEADFGGCFPADRVIVVGDTPHDIACARANDARVVAVATGRYTMDELQGADAVLPDLADTERVIAALIQPEE